MGEEVISNNFISGLEVEARLEGVEPEIFSIGFQHRLIRLFLCRLYIFQLPCSEHGQNFDQILMI